MLIKIQWDQQLNTLPTQFVAAITYVANLFDRLFTNAATVNLQVGYGEVGLQLGAGEKLLDANNNSNDLGETEVLTSSFVGVTDSQVQTALAAQNAPGSANLPTLGAPSLVTLYPAEAIALKLRPPASNPVGAVGFNSNASLFSWGFSTPANGLTYFVGVAEHEFSEALGRVSLLNTPQTGPSVMDLFRYSAQNVLDLSNSSNVATPAYFSLDQGKTDLDNWNTDPVLGDIGDWSSVAASAADDAFDAISNPNVVNVMSPADLAVMNALGWQVAASWAAAADGDFSTSSDWSYNIPPSPYVSARISALGSYTVTSSSNTAVGSLTIVNGATLGIDASMFEITATSGGSSIFGNINLSLGATLKLDGAVANHGTISIGDSEVTGGTIVNSGAVLWDGGSIIATRLISVGGGTFQTVSDRNATLTNTTITAGTTFTGEDGSFSFLSGAIVNNGVLALDDAGFSTLGNVTLAGTGVVQLSNSASNLIVPNSGTFTIGSGQTVQGSGTITTSKSGYGSGSIINNGTIDADQSTPLNVSITRNNGTLEATNGGTLIVTALQLNASTVKADGGTIDLSGVLTQAPVGVVKALNGSIVSFNGGGITGGQLFASNGGEFETVSGQNGTLTNTTITAGTTFTGEDGSFSFLSGAIVNNGVLALDDAGFSTLGNVTLAGTGVVQLSNSASNLIVPNSGTFTIGSGQTVQGSGTITTSKSGYGSGSIINNGTIDADQSTPLNVSITRNNGTLEATNGGTLIVTALQLNASTVKADGGTIDLSGVLTQAPVGVVKALNGSIVSFNGGGITGGQLFASNGGEFETVSGQNGTLTNTTITAGTTFTGEDGSFSFLSGAIVNNGVLALDDAGFSTLGNVTLAGTGVVQLSNSASNLIVPNSGTFTIGSGQTVQGSGTITTSKSGYGSGSIINNGTIDADQSTVLTVNLTSNAGKLEATNGGNLVIENRLGGSAVIDDGTIDIESVSYIPVIFGHSNAGTDLLTLADASNFHGQISNFSSGDKIDLSNVFADDISLCRFYQNATGSGGTLFVSDGTNTAHLIFSGQFDGSRLQHSNDSGTGTIISYV